jgi:glycosyltransferase involved in cell wall biosynthesis
MLSVIIATLDSERPLVQTLAALVPGATAGIISEVIVADGGSHDETAEVADVAGCNFLTTDGPLGRRLKAAAAGTRAPWLMFLWPGTVLDAPWTGEAGRFMQQNVLQQGSADGRAGIFRRDTGSQPALRQALALLTAPFSRPRPEQGLLIAKPFYAALGGHSESAADPEADLLRRIGRRRIVTLSTGAFHNR